LRGFNPNRDINEDRKLRKEIDFSELAWAGKRVNIVIDTLKRADKLERPIFMFTYPRLSCVWAVVIVSFVWFFDPRYLLSYVTVLILIVFGRGHPVIYEHTEPFMQ
jgi:hypothetical protein